MKLKDGDLYGLFHDITPAEKFLKWSPQNTLKEILHMSSTINEE